MKCLVPFYFFLLYQGAYAQISMHDLSVDEATALAKTEGKKVFVYVFDSWCDPCEDIEAYTFTDLEVIHFWNQHFISLSVDASAYPGLAIIDSYEVDYFPAFLFLDPSGGLLHKGCGGLDAAEFLRLGEEALEPQSNLAFYESKYEAGDRSTAFMLAYLDQKEYACEEVEKFAEDYLKEVALTDLTNETPWTIFATYQWDIYSREFRYLMRHKTDFEEKMGHDAVHAKIYDTYLSQYQELYASDEWQDYAMRALLYDIRQQDFEGADTLKLMMGLNHAAYRGDWDDYATQAVAFVNLMQIENPDELSELSWNFYRFVEDKKMLTIASEWAKKAVDTDPIPLYIDTYASLRFKLGKVKEAITLEEHALKLAQELGEDTSHYQYQLALFKQ